MFEQLNRALAELTEEMKMEIERKVYRRHYLTERIWRWFLRIGLTVVVLLVLWFGYPTPWRYWTYYGRQVRTHRVTGRVEFWKIENGRGGWQRLRPK